MDRKVKLVQIGIGNMGTYILRYALEKDADLVGVFDANPEIIGKDVAVRLGGNDLGVQIEDIKTLDERLKELKPDVAVVATMSLMRDVKDQLLTCARNGVNVVTTCDEAVYPWNSAPAVTAEIDQVAKENNVTITGAGFPDLSYCHLIAATAGAAHKITMIEGSAMYNAADYGMALSEHHGVGYSEEEYQKHFIDVDNISEEERQELIDNNEFTPAPMWNANGWLCERLGLTVKSQRQFNTPQYLDVDVESEIHGRTLKAGEIIGTATTAVTETEEGITIQSESIGRFYGPGEEDTNTWKIHGEPDIYVQNDHIDNTRMICSLMVSRIVDAINGPAGFVTSNHFQPARHILRPLNHYVEAK